MSTRANLILKDCTGASLFLYHHYDGNTAWLGNCLKCLVSKIRENYVDEFTIYEMATAFIRGVNVEYKEDGGNFFDGAYELTKELHGDIEYFYVIDLNWYEREIEKRVALTAFKVGYNEDWTKQCWREIEITDETNIEDAAFKR